MRSWCTAPAVLASRFKPVEVIKGSFRAKSKMTFSKVFIVPQNTLAVFLLAMALVMEAQYSKSLDRPPYGHQANILNSSYTGLTITGGSSSVRP